ncbi:hypothetical protein EFE20_07530 [Latilactobacillus curvatus]|nr:hypothetical protein [Latilactobacillus curvatus]MCS8607019.1 hypothetical protein [Latilactobacillus curvatus]MCS8617081.1 hypothetical protein [Latilactobacillus curvatus]
MFELENILEDFRLAGKQTLINLHWDVDMWDNADFDRLNTLLSTKDKKDRVVDPLRLIGKG